MTPYQLRQLNRVDWDFVSSSSVEGSGLHWYPGNFVPELPGAIIDILSNPGDRIFDPFGGIGTTALAALIRGRQAVSCDSNPIASLTSYVACGMVALRKQDPHLFDDIIDEVLTISTGSSPDAPLLRPISRDSGRIDELVAQVIDIAPDQFLRSLRRASPNVDALSEWYEAETLAGIVRLCAVVEQKMRSKFSQMFALLMISATCRSLCSQTQSWGHVADRVLPNEFVQKNPRAAYQNWLKRAKKRLCAIADTAYLPTKWPAVSIRSIDWMSAKTSTLKIKKATLLITSPPYAGAIDYTLAQRLSLYFLGYDDSAISKLVKVEMGARRKRTAPNHVASWADQLCRATELHLRFMSPKANAAFILPHKDAGRDKGEDQLKVLMEERGWEIFLKRDRSIRQVKARQSWTSIKRETLLVFGRK